MITISQPYIEHRGEESFLLSKVVDEANHKDGLVWYSVEKQYGQYLCDEVADAFVLVMLQLAMKTNQDIKVEAPVSSRLLFNIENTLQPLFVKAFAGFHHVKVMAQSAVENNYHGTAVGCGCSLGVDSFSALLKHLSTDVPENYRATHLALFNCGQLGDVDLKGAEENFHTTVASLQPFIEEVKLPLVAVNSNLNELYVDSEVKLLQSFVNRTVSCVLALQKLFGKYVYASSYSVEQFEFSPKDESHMETAFVPLLGTESTELILTPSVMTRVEKTEYLSQFDITYRYLDVCWAAQMKYCSDNNPTLLETKTKKNCGRCIKCMRTLLTLEILGKIDKYKEIFDIEEYYKKKKWFICDVARTHQTNIFSAELLDLMKRTHYPLPFKAKVLCCEGLGWGILRWGRKVILKIKRLISKN